MKIPLGIKLGLGPGHIVLDRDPATPQRSTAALPQFSAHVYCGQTAGWIKIPLGMDVGLDPGDIVLEEVISATNVWAMLWLGSGSGLERFCWQCLSVVSSSEQRH